MVFHSSVEGCIKVVVKYIIRAHSTRIGPQHSDMHECNFSERSPKAKRRPEKGMFVLRSQSAIVIN